MEIEVGRKSVGAPVLASMGEMPMSAFSIIVGWLLVNAVVFAALMLRRDRPALRNRLFLWVVDGRREAEEGLAAVGEPKVIRPVVGTDGDRVAAAVVGAIDK